MKPLISILTPAIPERLEKLTALMREIERQAANAGLSGLFEHIALVDTRASSSIGLKRDSLVQLARGQFVAFCDDDDQISPDYLPKLIAAIQANPTADVVTFRQRVTWCGLESEAIFGLGNANEPFTVDAPFRRAPWHVCAFRASIAKAHHFPHSNYGEDWAWARHVGADCASSVHIDAVLHHYIHDPQTTAAPAPHA